MYKFIGCTETRSPVIRNTARDTLCYIDEEKVESLAENFEKNHNIARESPSPIDRTFLHTNLPTHNKTLKCIPQQMKNIIKKLPKNKVTGQDIISTL